MLCMGQLLSGSHPPSITQFDCYDVITIVLFIRIQCLIIDEMHIIIRGFCGSGRDRGMLWPVVLSVSCVHALNSF